METKKCPFCGEEIKSIAIKCKHCGEFLNESNKSESTPIAEGNLKTIKEQKWYDKVWLIIILCIFFFPLGLYAFWMHSKASTINKVLYSLLISISPFLLGIVLFSISNLTNNTESLFSNNIDETTSMTTIKFNMTTEPENEDFNSFVNKFVSEPEFQKSRIIFPLVDFTGLPNNEITDYDSFSFTENDIFEGRKEFPDLATPVDGMFEKTDVNEVEYTYIQDGTCNKWCIAFKLKNKKWFLYKYQDFTE